MRSVSRSEIHAQAIDAGLSEFEKALKAVKALNVCRTSEIMLAIENWVASGMLTEKQADALCAYFGWERAP
jgi:hypothetical protein